MTERSKKTAIIRLMILAAQREGNRQLLANLEAYSLTPSQAEVIDLLSQHGNLSVKEIGELLICETGSPSRLINSMAAKEFITIQQDSEDKRIRRLSLSKRGYQQVDNVKKAFGEVDKFIDFQLNADEQRVLQKLLDKMLINTHSTAALQRRK